VSRHNDDGTLTIVTAALDHAYDLADFVRASPTSYHAAVEGARRLADAGFVSQDEVEEWEATPGGHYLVRDGALMAWWIPDGATGTTPFRIVGSHTDSPGFKLKPRADVGAFGWQQVGVEIYGGPLLNSWLDRELGLAGRLFHDRSSQLVRTQAIMRIPQLAIHLDRGVNEDGVKLDKQQHTVPVWGVGSDDLRILDHLAGLAGCEPEEILGHDVLAFDTAPPVIFGSQQEFLASGRLDNLSSVHASVTAMIAMDDGAYVTVLAAFDHEELGSESRSGAAGPILSDVLSRTAHVLGATPDQHHRALAGSFCLSADAGHAVHPNYASRHDLANRPLLNGGPLLKLNANQRYATDARGSSLWRRACRAAGIATQEFVSHNSVPCGSTIGPLTATRLGITTIDVGVPLLSMHSARELAGVEDPYALAQAITAFLSAD
jgi:aspartyl aminopeptidase